MDTGVWWYETQQKEIIFFLCMKIFNLNVHDNKLKDFAKFLTLNFVTGIVAWFLVVKNFEKLNIYPPLIQHPFNGGMFDLITSAVLFVPFVEEIIFRYHLRFYRKECKINKVSYFGCIFVQKTD
jgi:membrane protease YdiL (CAAX protease family)